MDEVRCFGFRFDDDGCVVWVHGDGEDRLTAPGASRADKALAILEKCEQLWRTPVVQNGGPERIGIPLGLDLEVAANQAAFMLQKHGPLPAKLAGDAVRAAPQFLTWLSTRLRQQADPQQGGY